MGKSSLIITRSRVILLLVLLPIWILALAYGALLALSLVLGYVAWWD